MMIVTSEDDNDDDGNGATGDEVDNDGDGATGDGATGYGDNNNDGGGTMGGRRLWQRNGTERRGAGADGRTMYDDAMMVATNDDRGRDTRRPSPSCVARIPGKDNNLIIFKQT